MGIAEKEGGFPVFVTDILKHFFFFFFIYIYIYIYIYITPTAEIIAQLPGKIGMYIPATEGLKVKPRKLVMMASN